MHLTILSESIINEMLINRSRPMKAFLMQHGGLSLIPQFIESVCSFEFEIFPRTSGILVIFDSENPSCRNLGCLFYRLVNGVTCRVEFQASKWDLLS
jgi:hypothetical protein